MGDFLLSGTRGGSGGGIGTLLTPTGNDAVDTAALIDAYASAVENKQPIYLGPGTWNITTAIEQEFQTSGDYCPQIYGSGPNHTILVNATGGDAIFKYTQSAYYTYGFGGSLNNLTLRGNGTTGEHAIRMTGVWIYQFINVHFEDFTGGNYVVWYDQEFVSGNPDQTANAHHTYIGCRWIGSVGSDMIYCGLSDNTTYGMMVYMLVYNCRMVEGNSAYRGGGRFFDFSGNQLGYTKGAPCIDMSQPVSDAGVSTFRNNGFEGCSDGALRLTGTGYTVENNRFTGRFTSVSYPDGDYTLVQLGNGSDGCELSQVRNNIFSYGDITKSDLTTRVYVVACDFNNATKSSFTGSQFPLAGTGTFEDSGHTRTTATTYSAIEIANNGLEHDLAKRVTSQSLADGETFTADFFLGAYWHVYLAAEGSPPSSGYTIANPDNSPVNTSSPGLNSGCEFIITIENQTGHTLTDSDFTWGSELRALALPSIPTGDRVFAHFVANARAQSISEALWQTTDWVVH